MLLNHVAIVAKTFRVNPWCACVVSDNSENQRVCLLRITCITTINKLDGNPSKFLALLS